MQPHVFQTNREIILVGEGLLHVAHLVVVQAQQVHHLVSIRPWKFPTKKTSPVRRVHISKGCPPNQNMFGNRNKNATIYIFLLEKTSTAVSQALSNNERVMITCVCIAWWEWVKFSWKGKHVYMHGFRIIHHIYLYFNGIYISNSGKNSLRYQILITKLWQGFIRVPGWSFGTILPISWANISFFPSLKMDAWKMNFPLGWLIFRCFYC